jgi:hypothetical protein
MLHLNPNDILHFVIYSYLIIFLTIFLGVYFCGVKRVYYGKIRPKDSLLWQWKRDNCFYCDKIVENIWFKCYLGFHGCHGIVICDECKSN